MILHKAILVGCGTLLFSMSLSAQSATFFAYKSDVGDYVGEGQSNSYDATQAKFTVDMPNKDMTFYIENQKIDWQLIFGAPTSGKFDVGTYTNATRFSTRTTPGINVSSIGRGCNQTSGEFKVLDFQYDKNQQISSVAIDFVQHCEKFTPALYGAIRYNSSVPNDLDDYIKSLFEKTSMIFFSEPGDRPGGGKTKIFSTDDNAYLVSSRDQENTIHISYDAADDWTSLDFAAPKGIQLTKGFYDEATRYPLQSSDTPGLDINGVCNELYGKFKVLEATYDEKGQIKNLAIDFIQHCEQKTAAPLIGAIRYHSQIPLDIALPGVFKTSELDLPYIQIGQQYYHVKFNLLSLNPAIFKVASIEDATVKSDEIRVSSLFDSYSQTLYIPQINLTDVFGKIHLLEDTQLKSQLGGFHVGDTFILLSDSNNVEFVKFLKK